VGSYKPNAWGLYDCLGNVRECTLDYREGNPSTDTVDPVGKTVDLAAFTDPTRILRATRGGHYSEKAFNCALPTRSFGDPGREWYPIQGCRIAWRFPFAGTDAAAGEGAQD